MEPNVNNTMMPQGGFQGEPQSVPDTTPVNTDSFLTEAKDVFGKEFNSRDEVKNYFNELGSYKNKYEEFTGKFSDLEHKARLAEEYESHPLVPQFKEFVKNLDSSDPTRALQQVSQFTKLHATDWNSLAEKDPLTVIIEKEYTDAEGYATRDQIERMVRKQFKLDPSQYHDLDEEEAEDEARTAKLMAIKKAREAADYFNGKKADFSKHPGQVSRQQQQQMAEEFAKQYKAAMQDAVSSFKELEFGDFRYKVDGEPGSYTKAAIESPESFLKTIALDESGKNYDPAKMVRLALVMDHLNDMLKASAGTAKSSAIREVLDDAARTTAPGTKPTNGSDRPKLGNVPFLSM